MRGSPTEYNDAVLRHMLRFAWRYEAELREAARQREFAFTAESPIAEVITALKGDISE